MLLFKRILDFKKTEGGLFDKRGAKRYPVGAKSPLKTKITLVSRDGEGKPLQTNDNVAMDWGGQLLNLSITGASVRLHPAAVATSGENCCLKLEIDNKLFELDGTVAHFHNAAQYVTCGIAFKFADTYTRKAYLQVMEPVVIGSTLAPVTSRVKQDRPNLLKEQYCDEAKSLLNIWCDAPDKNPRLFELLVNDYYVRGSTERPGLMIGYREGAKGAKRGSRPSTPLTMSKDHQAEVLQLFQLIVPNLTKNIPSAVRKFLELFSV